VKPYLVSLALGIVVGAVYALMRVRSPAPPVVALVGLLGMLVGERGLGLVLALLWPLPAAQAAAVAPTSISPSSPLPGEHHAP
jgi:XapX domain-containing protein